MPRAPFQVLVFPYCFHNNTIDYCFFQRSDDSNWQGIAGGGEDTETPIEAARRESKEEANIESNKIILLQTITSIPVNMFKNSEIWGNELYVIPEYSFGLEIGFRNVSISVEHMNYKWCSYNEAHSLLKYDGNRTALWELNRRLLNIGPRD